MTEPAGVSTSGPRVFLTAEWRSLLMLNYAVNPEVLAPFLPRGLELDCWEATPVISIVGFLFNNVRVLGWAIPFHRNFEEVNLRFYVRRRTPDGWRRGVVFVKEIVPRVAVASIARLLYNENYSATQMRHFMTPEEAVERKIEYSWRTGTRWNSVKAMVRGWPEPIVAGSEAEFIFEHYWGYSRQRDGGSVEYEVRHPAWRIWLAKEARLDCDAGTIYGGEFAEILAGPPQSAFVAEGSEVAVLRGIRI